MTHAKEFSHFGQFLLLFYQGKREHVMLNKLQFCFVKHIPKTVGKNEWKKNPDTFFNHLNSDGIKVCKIIYLKVFQV